MECSVGKFIDNCCEIRLTAQDVQIFHLDNPDILLEVRPNQDEYGAYYTAKGRQWDIWCRAEECQGNTAFAMRDPIQAVRDLLARKWRADFDFNPDEDD
jgi:hypothetical protein